jgi:hypothetical protein
MLCIFVYDVATQSVPSAARPHVDRRLLDGAEAPGADVDPGGPERRETRRETPDRLACVRPPD